ncbi:MAG: hypothetical protein ABL898_12865 [Hyphomicrobiaceae bacterium]
MIGLDELAALNKAQRENWLPIVPTLSPASGHIDPEHAFAIVARTGNGDVVAAHAARCFDWTDTNFVDELTSLRLFYQSPATSKQPNETCSSSASFARELTGRVVYSGAAWIHPNYRGRHLTAIVPRVAKALALTKWNPDFIASLMTSTVFNAGFFERFGYQKIDWEVVWSDSPITSGALKFAIVWMQMPHLIEDLTGYIESASQINGRVRERNAS